MTHKGNFYALDDVTLAARPTQNPCRIWIASNPVQHGPVTARGTERVLRRAAKLASSSSRLALGSVWWTLIEDLRTSLKQHPLDLVLMRELLGEAA